VRFLLRLLVNAMALGVAQWAVDGIAVDRWQTLIPVALIFGFVNAFFSPLVKILTCPLILLTLGIFTLVVNALMLQLTSWFAGMFSLGFRVYDFWSAFWGALIISITSIVLTMVLGDSSDD